jgi:hypothetical protein
MFVSEFYFLDRFFYSRDYLFYEKLSFWFNSRSYHEFLLLCFKSFVKIIALSQVIEISEFKIISLMLKHLSRDVITHNIEDCESRVLLIKRSQK